MTSVEDYIMVAAFTLAGGLVFALGFVKMRKYRIIRDTPRSKIRSMAMGIVEIHGEVEADQLIKSPFSKTDCVYYRWEIKEYRRRTSGKKKRTTYQWETVGSDDRSVPFFAKDETGRALVNPERAEFDVANRRIFYQERQGIVDSLLALPNLLNMLKNIDPSDPSSFDIGGEKLVPIESGFSFRSTSVGDRKYYESYVESGDKLFVLGTAATDRSAPDNVVIKRGRNEKTFIISDKGEKTVLKGLKKLMLVCFIIGGVFIIAGVVMLMQMLEIIPRG